MVLLAGIVVIGAVVVGVIGGQTLGDLRQTTEVSHAEHAMTKFDERASGVALGADRTGTQAVPVPSIGRGGALRTTRESWMRVSMVNATTGVTDVTVVNESLGTVVHVNGETTIGYEGGGVWRSDEQGTTMISPPEFHVSNRTLTIPLVSVRGDASLHDPVVVEGDGPPERRFPNATAGLGNKIADGKVAVTVHSAYYTAWGRYFERSTDAVVTYDHGAASVTATFLALPRTTSLRSGIIATSGNGEVRLGGNSIYIDSYDSSRGTGRYNDTKGANGSITAVNDVVSTGSSSVQGTVRSGAVVDLSGTTEINGTVYWTDDYQQDGAAVNGGDEQIDGVATLEPIDGLVEKVVAEIRQANDNANVSVISATNRIEGSGTLPTGAYYLTDLTLGAGDTLDVDTTEGDVAIAVANTITIAGKGTQSSKAARLNVIGNGTVTVYVLGDDPVDLVVGKNGQVDVPAERSGQFRIYGPRNFDAELTSDKSPAEIRFEGVIYAPAGYTGSGSVVVGQAAFFGAIVSGDLTVKQGAKIHYDEGLADERFPRSPTAARIEFMHVTVHHLHVTSR